MKKVFPVIILLITLSVLGILFIQMQWIRNSILVKKEQYQQMIESTLRDVRDQTYKNWLMERRPFTDEISAVERDIWLQGYTSQIFSAEEIGQIIERNLRKYNIRQSFSFCIVDALNSPVVVSDDFQSDYFRSSYRIVLTPERSILHEVLHLYIHEPENYIMSKMGWMIAASILFTFIIIAAFALTLRTMLNQKKLSEIKSDFINNMTHELKTPLATISLAVDALNNEKVIHNEDQIKYYSGIIKAENKRMNKQVEKILQSARLERQEIKLHLQNLNAHDVIRKVADNLALQIDENQGELKLKLQAAHPNIMADEVHFSNIIFNLLDNAIKYSKESPRIEVETAMHQDMLAIRVRDQGIGMNKETQSRIFEKFYRAHTGNLHNVKGFGLGLSYVKGMVDAHDGKIRVDSTPGKGSTFTILLPRAQGGHA